MAAECKQFQPVSTLVARSRCADRAAANAACACRRGIPFVVAGRERLAEDPGVAALLSYLAVLADPAHDPAFEAVLSLPHHGLGGCQRLAACCVAAASQVVM